MTRPLQNFKIVLAIVALCLPLGCINDSPSPQMILLTQRLQTLQVQSKLLQEQALNVESQIDEVRRASTENKSAEIETLRAQFNTLKETHINMQQEMSALREHLRQTTPSR